MQSAPSRRLSAQFLRRGFSTSAARLEIRDVGALSQRLIPKYRGRLIPCKILRDLEADSSVFRLENGGELLALQWPAPPRNVLLVRKDCAPAVTDSLVEFAKYFISPSLTPTSCLTQSSNPVTSPTHIPILPSFSNPKPPPKFTSHFPTQSTPRLWKTNQPHSTTRLI